VKKINTVETRGNETVEGTKLSRGEPTISIFCRRRATISDGELSSRGSRQNGSPATSGSN
jgi:hypothetical protein